MTLEKKEKKGVGKSKKAQIKEEFLEAISEGVERAFPEELKVLREKYGNPARTVLEAIQAGIEYSSPTHDCIYEAIRDGISNCVNVSTDDVADILRGELGI